MKLLLGRSKEVDKHAQPKDDMTHTEPPSISTTSLFSLSLVAFTPKNNERERVREQRGVVCVLCAIWDDVSYLFLQLQPSFPCRIFGSGPVLSDHTTDTFLVPLSLFLLVFFFLNLI